jgi:hypothetical protein
VQRSSSRPRRPPQEQRLLRHGHLPAAALRLHRDRADQRHRPPRHRRAHLRGVTKPVTIDLEFTGAAVDPWGNTRIGFEGSTQVNRKDWGVNWNTALEAGGVLVSEKVTLAFDISATKDP